MMTDAELDIENVRPEMETVQPAFAAERDVALGVGQHCRAHE